MTTERRYDRHRAEEEAANELAKEAKDWCVSNMVGHWESADDFADDMAETIHLHQSFVGPCSFSLTAGLIEDYFSAEIQRWN